MWNPDRAAAERTLSGKRLHNDAGLDAHGWVEIQAGTNRLCFNEGLLQCNV